MHPVTHDVARHPFFGPDADCAAEPRHSDAQAPGRFIVDAKGILVTMNQAGSRLIDRGIVLVDARGQLRLPRAPWGMSELIQSRASRPFDRIYQIGPRLLMRAMGAPAAEPSTFQLLVALITLESTIDLTLIIEAFGISECEAPVLGGLASATCPKETSRQLNLSIHTVRSHLRAIYAKLGVRSAAEAQRLVLELYYTGNCMRELISHHD
jgi:hypothetical protein